MVCLQPLLLRKEQSLLFLQLLHLKVVLHLQVPQLLLVLLFKPLPLKLLLHEGVGGIRQRAAHS